MLKNRGLHCGVGFVQSYKNGALMAKKNHDLSAIFSGVWEKCAHFSIYDCFECLSPHRIPA